MEGSETEKQKKVMEIKTLYAFDLICRKKKFEEALDLFTEIGTGTCITFFVFVFVLFSVRFEWACQDF